MSAKIERMSMTAIFPLAAYGPGHRYHNAALTSRSCAIDYNNSSQYIMCTDWCRLSRL